MNLKVDGSPDLADTLPKVTFGRALPTLEEIERFLVEEALVRSKNIQSIAADLLGITRQALSYRFKKIT